MKKKALPLFKPATPFQLVLAIESVTVTRTYRPRVTKLLSELRRQIERKP